MRRWNREEILITDDAGFLIPDRRRLEAIPPED
jgi:hypothetical protein